MKFATIEPAESRWTYVEAREPWELYALLGLPCDGGVDHAVVLPWHAGPKRIGVAIVVDQFSLYVPPEHQRYFTIGRRLYAGNAILYGYNEEGMTVDLPLMPVVVFITRAGIEAAIRAGSIDRPTMTANDEKIWEWPNRAPFSLPGQP